MSRFGHEGSSTPPQEPETERQDGEERAAGALPPFTDPAHSPAPAGSPVQAGAASYAPPPTDTEYAGHPDFAQDAAANKPPKAFGNSEPAGDVEEETRHSEGVDPPEPLIRP